MSSLNESVMIWFVLLIVAGIAEGLTATSLVAIWFIPGILVGIIMAALGKTVGVQVVAFTIVTVASLILTKPIADKILNRKIIPTNSDTIIGHKGLVIEEVNQVQGTGIIKVDGKEWSAKSENDKILYVGDVVKVLRVEGVKAVVRHID